MIPASSNVIVSLELGVKSWGWVAWRQSPPARSEGEKARVLGEEAGRRLSGHGFSTEGREERRM